MKTFQEEKDKAQRSLWYITYGISYYYNIFPKKNDILKKWMNNFWMV